MRVKGPSQFQDTAVGERSKNACVKGPSRLQETARAAIRSHRVWKCSVGQYERARRRHRHALDKFGAHASHASMLDVGSASRGVALRAHEKDAEMIV